MSLVFVVFVFELRHNTTPPLSPRPQAFTRMPPRPAKTLAPPARLASSRAGSAAHMLGWLLLGLALTAGLWAAAVATHPDDDQAQQVLTSAWAVPAGGDEFPAEDLLHDELAFVRHARHDLLAFAGRVHECQVRVIVVLSKGGG